MAKYCERCGKEIRDEASFCKYCGCKQHISEQPTGLYDSSNSEATYETTKSSGLSKFTMTIIAGALIVIFVMLIVGTIFYLSKPDENIQTSDHTITKNETGTGSDKSKEPEKVEDKTKEVRLADKVPEGAKEHNGHYYMIVNESLYWEEAKDACENRDGHLATITSQDEQDFIVSLIEQDGEKFNYCLGGTDEGHEGTWKWITGEAWDYTNWRANQPNNKDGNDEGDQDYLQICCVSKDDVERYGYWWDMSNTGVSQEYMHAPYYKDTQYSGYICEWE